MNMHQLMYIHLSLIAFDSGNNFVAWVWRELGEVSTK